MLWSQTGQWFQSMSSAALWHCHPIYTPRSVQKGTFMELWPIWVCKGEDILVQRKTKQKESHRSKIFTIFCSIIHENIYYFYILTYRESGCWLTALLEETRYLSENITSTLLIIKFNNHKNETFGDSFYFRSFHLVRIPKYVWWLLRNAAKENTHTMFHRRKGLMWDADVWHYVRWGLER